MRKELVVLIVIVAVVGFSTVGLASVIANFGDIGNGGHFTVGSTPIYNSDTANASMPLTAIAMTDDSMGNIFVLWSDGNVFEHPDMGGHAWKFLGNPSSFTSYMGKPIDLGSPVGIRASYNWENKAGLTTGLLMVLFSNGYAAYMAYGKNPQVWQLTKLPSGDNYVALSYNLNDYAYVGAHNQVFYATEQNGTTYAFSDHYYEWTSIISTPVTHNITAALAWPNNFAPPTVGTIVLLSVTASGYIYFFQGTTNPLSTGAWTEEGKIAATNPKPYFDGITQTSNPSSPYYYYATERAPGSYLYASAAFNGSGSSFSPMNPIPSINNQTALQNKYFGFEKAASELILTSNGDIYDTSTEGATFTLLYSVPSVPVVNHQVNVMPWIYQTGPGVFNGLNRLKASLNQLNQTYGNYTLVSYEFYQLQSSGKITPLTTGTLSYANSSNPNNITGYIHALGLGAVPMIISASASDIYHFASNESLVSSDIALMTQYAVEYNYTGYDIDWEPSSANNTTGALFTSFLNDFSLSLNKFDKKLFVEVASWDPTFWNYTNIGMTNITSENIMDYAGSYSGPSSFLSEMQLGISEIPSGKLSISLENTNPNTNVNFTPIQMEQRFMSLEQYNIKFIGLWDMPFNISLVSQIQDYVHNYTGSSTQVLFGAGSSGISVQNSILATSSSYSNSANFSYYAGDYLNGNVFVGTNFSNKTLLTTFNFDNYGTRNLYLYAQNATGWHNLSSRVLLFHSAGSVTLPSNTFNVRVMFGNFSDSFTTTSYSGKIVYSLQFTKLVYKSWIDVYYLTGASLSLNGVAILNSPNSTITGYGIWSLDNISVVPGMYNVSVTELGYSGYFSNVVTTSENTTTVYSQTALVSGYIKGSVTPKGATVLINGAPVTVNNGEFSFTGPAGTYYVNATMQFYHDFSEKVTVIASATTYANITLSYLPPTAISQYVPVKVNNTTFSLGWSQFYGTDFQNYSIFLSTSSTSIGTFVASLTSITDTAYNLTGLSYNTTYFVTIVVYAQNGHVNSNVEKITTPAQTVAKPPKSVTTPTPSSTTLYIIIGVVVAVVVVGSVAAILIRSKGLKK